MKKILSIMALCALSASCSQSQDSSPAVDHAKKMLSDSEITLKVKQVILMDGSLSPSNRFVSITTTNGVVVITGQVSNADQMQKIADKAKTVDGVKRVDNQMTLSAPQE